MWPVAREWNKNVTLNKNNSIIPEDVSFHLFILPLIQATLIDHLWIWYDIEICMTLHLYDIAVKDDTKLVLQDP